MSQNGCMRSRATVGCAHFGRNILPQIRTIAAINKCLSGVIKKFAGTADVDGGAVERAPFTVFLQFA